ncbi:hypothetical protein [Desulfonatronum thiosulfatophilum]|uniref:hypothetical protein n=1 Tax=Desulfonatronum thiosulfatophilum TaxID=617002 RepID=UPI0011137C40|nr:hypothetical protein [Desulfonatronum thiosulfatophilum]
MRGQFGPEYAIVLAPDRFAVRREALRWYYLEGRKRMKQEKGPSPGKTEPGDEDRGSGTNPPLKFPHSGTLRNFQFSHMKIILRLNFLVPAPAFLNELPT